MARIKIKVVRLPHAQGLELPAYQTAGAAGMDLLAAVGEGRPLTLAPSKWALIPTGLMLELPAGVEAQVRPRSGLALRNGVTVLNSPGTIDSDYRGEVGVVLINLGTTKFKIERGARIAQLVVQKVERAALVEATSTASTARGAGGFGSTGVSAARGAGATAKKGGGKARKKASAPKAVAAAARAATKPAGSKGLKPARAGKRTAGRTLVATNPQNQRRLAAHRQRGARSADLRRPVSPRSP
jgi:dUTP pyrophosphatase